MFPSVVWLVPQGRHEVLLLVPSLKVPTGHPTQPVPVEKEPGPHSSVLTVLTAFTVLATLSTTPLAWATTQSARLVAPWEVDKPAGQAVQVGNVLAVQFDGSEA